MVKIVYFICIKMKENYEAKLARLKNELQKLETLVSTRYTAVQTYINFTLME